MHRVNRQLRARPGVAGAGGGVSVSSGFDFRQPCRWIFPLRFRVISNGHPNAFAELLTNCATTPGIILQLAGYQKERRSYPSMRLPRAKVP
jgi:hypothetical protein